jgi:DNA ligase (NAD+)
MNNPPVRLNEPLINLMEQLSNLMSKQGEPFRARAYQKAQEMIITHTRDILSPNDLKGMPNIGPTIMEKINEYYLTGTLALLEREKTNPINILSNVYGIGPKKAKELVDGGITTIEELIKKQNTVLNDTQKVGLHYYNDILKRIPRSEIEEYKSIFIKSISQSDAKMEIVGSYRRGAETSGDIDVIITTSNPGIFKKFVDDLISKGIIKEVLSRGQTKCLVITKLPNVIIARRVDFLYTSPEEFPFAILYFTGSKIFNTVMRHEALEKGFTMNEHGLYLLTDNSNNKKGIKGEKVKHLFTSEKDIFDYLELEYKEPHERTDGRAIIKISSTVKEMITAFKKKGISFLSTLNEIQLTEMVKHANIMYRNFQPIMTDNEYDILEEYIKEHYSANPHIHKIGATIEKNKATLPYYMPSMKKIKPDTDVLKKWMKTYTGPYILSCKLDGVSGLYTTENNIPKLYTRGEEGIEGGDISYLIPHLRLPKTKGIVIRGELIIPKHIFNEKYKTQFANPRNLVAGIINQKTLSGSLRDVHFVSYEVIQPILKPSDQIHFLGTLDVESVFTKIETNNSLTNELLSETLIDWRKSHPYEIDGIIVVDDKIYTRKLENPDHAFAFKMVLSDQIAEAKVVDVIWTPSKDGYLIPRVQIEPIHLGGVRIEYATGFNGAFIHENKVGIGALIELIRSGDVIPYIRKVTIPAEEAKMPSVPFKWNDTHIDVLLEDIQGDKTVKEKIIAGFFIRIEVEGLSSGNIARIIKAGFDTIPKIIKMTMTDFLHVEGFKETLATKIYNGIREKLTNASLVTIMSGTNLFGRGFGEKKLELIMGPYPEVLLSKESNSEKVRKLAALEGLTKQSAESFVANIPEFIRFIQEAGLNHKLLPSLDRKQNTDETHPLFGKTIIMTGFRDGPIQEALKKVGAKLGSSVSKNTFIVLVKDLNEDTGKVSDAKRLGILLMTPEMFKEKYRI